MSTGKYFWLLSIGAASIALCMPAPAPAQEAVMLERPADVAQPPPDADKTKRTKNLSGEKSSRQYTDDSCVDGPCTKNLGTKNKLTGKQTPGATQGIVVIDGKPTPGAAQGIVVIGGKPAAGATQGIIVQNPGAAQGIILQNPGTPSGFTTPGGSPGMRTK